MTSRNETLVKNTLIIALGKLSTQFLTFLLLPLYTTFLTSSEFGIADIVVTYISIFAPTITLSLDAGAFRFLIDVRNDEKRKHAIVSNIMQITAAMSVGFFILYALALCLFDIPFGWIVPITVVVVMLSNMFMQFARGFGNNIKFSVAGLIAGSVTIVANILLIVILHSGSVGIVLAMLFGNFAAALYLFISLRLHRYISFKNQDRMMRKKLLRYSIPMAPNNIAWWLISVADKTIITIFLGLPSAGIYAVASRFPMIFRSLFSFFGLSWTESASLHISSHDRDQYFSQTINTSLRLFGSMAVGIIAVVPLFIGLLVNEEFKEARLYIPVLIIGSFAYSVVGLYGAIYVAKKLTKQVATTTIIASVISVIVSLVLIQFIGIYAVALATLVAYTIMAIYRNIDMRKYVNIKYDKGIFFSITLLLIVTSVLYYINNPLLNIINALFAGAFAFVLNKSTISVVKRRLLMIGRKGG